MVIGPSTVPALNPRNTFTPLGGGNVYHGTENLGGPISCLKYSLWPLGMPLCICLLEAPDVPDKGRSGQRLGLPLPSTSVFTKVPGRERVLKTFAVLISSTLSKEPGLLRLPLLLPFHPAGRGVAAVEDELSRKRESELSSSDSAAVDDNISCGLLLVS